jgi:hypothetical protein
MKFVTVVRAPSGQQRQSFQDWCAEDFLPGLRAAAPSLRAGVVRRKIASPYPTPPTGAAPYDDDRSMAYDVMLEMWLPCSEDFRREVLPAQARLREIGCEYASCAVLPRLQKDPRAAEAGASGRRPELTYVLSIRWQPTVTAEFASQDWDQHSAIALRAQKSMSKYEQNVVIEKISWTPGATVADAFADFSFPTRDDFLTGFVVTEEELQDMNGLVGAFTATFLSDADPF